MILCKGGDEMFVEVETFGGGAVVGEVPLVDAFEEGLVGCVADVGDELGGNKDLRNGIKWEVTCLHNSMHSFRNNDDIVTCTIRNQCHARYSTTALTLRTLPTNQQRYWFRRTLRLTQQPHQSILMQCPHLRLQL